MAKTSPRAYFCDVCNQQTSRLFGFVAAIRVLATDDKPMTRFRSAVRGYCAAHRDEVPGRFAADAAAEGDVVFIGEPPAELRPAEADHFLKAADHMATDDAERGGMNARIELEDGMAPQTCPHCGGRLSYRTGPHVADAAARASAIAWECLDCQAAGMMFGTPL